MRRLLASLTVRGRAFVTAGLTVVVSAWAMGINDVARIGALLLLLPLLSALLTRRTRQRMSLTRSVQPSAVTVGQPAAVRVTVRNEGATSGLLLLEEQLPYALGVRPRFVVDRMGAGWRREVDYTVRSDVRGLYTLGPMQVRTCDPLGLVEITRTFTSTARLVITPRVWPLSGIPLGGVWMGAGDNRPREFAGGSAEDVTVRDYRRGDDLRRVHWRSSAHRGELMVRREEQPWQSRATVFVDNRARSHTGRGPASSLEVAVEAAASVALHLARRGYNVRLLGADQAQLSLWHEHSDGDTRPMLEQLAVLTTSQASTLNLGWLGEAHTTGLLVGIFARLDAADQTALTRLRSHATGALGLCLDTGATSLLVRCQWRAATLEATGAGLDDAWRRLGEPQRAPA